MDIIGILTFEEFEMLRRPVVSKERDNDASLVW